MFSQQDKQMHFLGGSLIGGVSYKVARKELKLSKWESVGFSVLTSTVIGIGKEMIDRPKTRFDWQDVGATSLGGLSVGITFIIFDNGNQKRHSKRIKKADTRIKRN